MNNPVHGGYDAQASSDDTVPTVIVGGTVLFREGLRRLLGPKGFAVTAADERVFGQGPADRLPRVAILCTQHKVELSLAEVRAARAQYPQAALVCLCSSFDEEQVVPMLESGAAAILTHTTGIDILIQTLELALLGHRIVPSLPPAAAEPNPEPAVEAEAPQPEAGPDAPVEASTFRPSPRETKIIACLVRGASNRDIALQLGLPENRVKGHVKAILRKMRVRNRTQAAIWGMKNPLGSAAPLAVLSETQAGGADAGWTGAEDGSPEDEAAHAGRPRPVGPMPGTPIGLIPIV